MRLFSICPSLLLAAEQWARDKAQFSLLLFAVLQFAATPIINKTLELIKQATGAVLGILSAQTLVAVAATVPNLGTAISFVACDHEATTPITLPMASVKAIHDVTQAPSHDGHVPKRLSKGTSEAPRLSVDRQWTSAADSLKASRRSENRQQQ